MVCCRFYLTAAPFVTNLSGAVRATDVMVNTGERDKPSSFLARARNNQRGYRFTPIAMLFSSSNIPILHPLNVDPDITKPPIVS